jgi:citrate lyase gamma subunit
MAAKINTVQLDDSEILKDWMRRHAETVQEVLVELDPKLLALMVHDRGYLGSYLIQRLKEAKRNQEERELPEEMSEEALDRRERARDMQIQLERGW